MGVTVWTGVTAGLVLTGGGVSLTWMGFAIPPLVLGWTLEERLRSLRNSAESKNRSF